MLLNIRIEANVCPTYQTHTIYFNSILPFNQKRGLFSECLISETLSHFSSIRSNSAISLHEFASQKQITERYKGVFVRNLQSRKKPRGLRYAAVFLLIIYHIRNSVYVSSLSLDAVSLLGKCLSAFIRWDSPENQYPSTNSNTI